MPLILGKNAAKKYKGRTSTDAAGNIVLSSRKKSTRSGGSSVVSGGGSSKSDTQVKSYQEPNYTPARRIDLANSFYEKLLYPEKYFPKTQQERDNIIRDNAVYDASRMSPADTNFPERTPVNRSIMDAILHPEREFRSYPNTGARDKEIRDRAMEDYWRMVTSPTATKSQFAGRDLASIGTIAGLSGGTPDYTRTGSVGGGFGGGTGGSWGSNPTAPKKQDTGGHSAGGGKAPIGEAGDSVSISVLKQALSIVAQVMGTPSDGITATSDDVDNALASMGNALDSAYEQALADLPDYEKMKEDAKTLYEMKDKILQDRMDTLEARYKEDVASIKEDYAGQKEDLQKKQDIQQGQLAGGLAAAGAYLGFDNVNQSAMLSLQVTHDREMTVLGQAKMAALSEARRAFEDSDFKLLTEQINAIDAYDQRINQLTKDHFDQTLKLTQEARNNVKFMQDTESFERARAFDNLDTIITSGKMPSNAEIAQYAKVLNLSPEEVKGYITAKQNTLELEKSRAKTDEDVKILSLLKGIDKGTFVTINGKRYEGLNTPSSSATSSSRVVNRQDVVEKFNSSPYAYSKVGQMSYGELAEIYSQETPPEDWLQMFNDTFGDELRADGYIEGDPETYDVYYAQMNAQWKKEQANFWGDTVLYGAIKDFKPDERNKILAQIRAETKRDVSIEDLQDESVWSRQVLAGYLSRSSSKQKTDVDFESLINE